MMFLIKAYNYLFKVWLPQMKVWICHFENVVKIKNKSKILQFFQKVCLDLTLL